MSVTTYNNAVDEMFAAFKTAWEADSGAVVGYVPEVRWQGVEEPDSLPTDVYWVRVSQQTVTDVQSTFKVKNKRYTTDGLIIIQLFCPKADSKNMTSGRKLSIIARDTYRKSTSNVWFKNSRIQEIPPEEKFTRFNIIAEYNYDEQC